MKMMMSVIVFLLGPMALHLNMVVPCLVVYRLSSDLMMVISVMRIV